ncbi:hypothetical protein [Actibacterium lipolyticum]|uniref:Cytochrome c-552 n=1 Tax=Actibacterium lipolyticum TaxID=1524263 RepID=A0A238KQE7_9RHOB|nr:hypothetical protein [Actibacterium lipolyticum]SMX44342.1 Cytochrome c-552 precursor [Actibacterium lipolyticum]
MPSIFRYLIIAMLMLSQPAVAQEREFGLMADDTLKASGLMQYILPRFALKTGRRAALVDTDGDAQLGAEGRPVLARGDQVYGLTLLSENPAAASFADWLLSDIGQRTVAAFTPETGAPFTGAAGQAGVEQAVVFDGDAARGATLAGQHCGRCHVVSDATRMTSIGSTPSFHALRTLPNWEERFMAFFALNPHPAFMRVEEVSPEFDPQRPPPIVPVLLTLDEVEAIQAYAASLQPADLGAPVIHQ